MPSFTTAAKDEILSNKAVRQHFPNQQSFGLMVFSREFSVPKMQMLPRERRAAQYLSLIHICAMGNNSAKELMEQLGLTDDVQP